MNHLSFEYLLLTEARDTRPDISRDKSVPVMFWILMQSESNETAVALTIAFPDAGFSEGVRRLSSLTIYYLT